MPPEVLRFYAVADGAEVVALGNHGGFSGARLWRGTGPTGEFCLRAWPAGTASKWLAAMHSLLDQANVCGLAFVPRLQRARDGASFVLFQERCWEVVSWMLGAADFYRCPSVPRLDNAVTALAQIHEAWRPRTMPQGPCPAVHRRLRKARQWQELLDAGWRPQFSELHPASMNFWAERAWPLLRSRISSLPLRLQPWLAMDVPLQPCLCDIWHDHVLFTGDAVTGIVDYGNVRLDHVAVDLARLLGSMVGDDKAMRLAALAAYRRLRHLSEHEIALMELLDETGTLLGAANWLMWVYHEGRVFADMERAALRLATLVQRLEA